MNNEWSEKNKEMQALLAKETTYREGIQKLLELRTDLFQQVTYLMNLPKEAFSKRPFAGDKGYHSKTIAYSIWHVFRIEDIVVHELIAGDTQVLFRDGNEEAIHPSLITTGNELEGEAIVEFSRGLDVNALYSYAKAVKESTDEVLGNLIYADLKRKFSEEDKEKLAETGCVSRDENAFWLIDYWCGKDVRGLLKMPLSRHWMMHIEAAQRIKNKLCKLARKGVDPIACCGFSCNHCFLGQWCGSCRTEYNTCSFATCFPDRKCPNVSCCREKGLDGCYECEELETCEKGFYIPGNDGAQAAKAQAMFLRNHSKKEFLRLHDRLHEQNDFAKTQELLGQDRLQGLQLLEEQYEKLCSDEKKGKK